VSQLSPHSVLCQVASAIPENCRQHIIVIGSLAAAHAYFGTDTSKGVRTKDVDCVLEPFSIAVESGQNIVHELFNTGWQRRMQGDHQEPGDENTPPDELPAVRLYPPDVDPDSEGAWFLEFLSVPESPTENGKSWTPLKLREGYFGLPSFRFLSIAAFEPELLPELGLRRARPEMMALANLLEHPTVGVSTMSSPIGGRTLKRANKDLGRVLAITALADLDDYRPWGNRWKAALATTFPDEWHDLALQTGQGLRHLIHSEADLEEAYHSCINGLLSSQQTTLGALRAAGERLTNDAIERLELLAREE
jgi:hypothetical protein